MPVFQLNIIIFAHFYAPRWNIKMLQLTDLQTDAIDQKNNYYTKNRGSIRKSCWAINQSNKQQNTMMIGGKGWMVIAV